MQQRSKGDLVKISETSADASLSLVTNVWHVRVTLSSFSRFAVVLGLASFQEAFHLATVGGAEVLGLADVVGNFVPGKQVR